VRYLFGVGDHGVPHEVDAALGSSVFPVRPSMGNQFGHSRGKHSYPFFEIGMVRSPGQISAVAPPTTREAEYAYEDSKDQD